MADHSTVDADPLLNDGGASTEQLATKKRKKKNTKASDVEAEPADKNEMQMKRQRKKLEKQESRPPFAFQNLTARWIDTEKMGLLETIIRACPREVDDDTNAIKFRYIAVKKLVGTDTTKHHGRLLLNKNETFLERVLQEILLPEEKEAVEEGSGLRVPVLDEAGRSWTLVFKYWESNRGYVLNTGDWFRIVQANGFAEEQLVELHSFREALTNRLCFVIRRVAIDSDQVPGRIVDHHHD